MSVASAWITALAVWGSSLFGGRRLQDSVGKLLTAAYRSRTPLRSRLSRVNSGYFPGWSAPYGALTSRMMLLNLSRSQRAFLVLCLLCATVAHAADLAGVVTSKSGTPKVGVVVDVLGPSKVYTQTDTSGSFLVHLMPGAYTVRVRDGNHHQEFTQDVSDAGVHANYQLAW